MTAPARRPEWLPFAIVGGVGLSLAVLQYVLDNEDKLVFSVPILGLTAVLLLVMALARRGGDDLGRVASETGLTDAGVAPLPAVTPILRDVREPARVLAGRLPDHGPRVRVAQVRGRLVAISETSATALSDQASAWLIDQPLPAQAGVEDGLLVVAVPGDTGGRELVAVVEGVSARL